MNGDIAAPQVNAGVPKFQSAHVNLAEGHDLSEPVQPEPTPTPPPQPEPTPEPTLPNPEPPQQVPPPRKVEIRKKSRKGLWISLAVVLALLIGAGALWFTMQDNEPEMTPPIQRTEVCEYDNTIDADDPDCVAPEVCEFDNTLNPDDPDCVEPACEYDSSIKESDPECVEPEKCEFNDEILASDPSCLDPEDEKK